MENQVMVLKEKGIAAEYLFSTQTASAKNKVYEDLESGKLSLSLLYVTPELIATTGFMARLTKIHSRGLLNLIAVDEAKLPKTFFSKEMTAQHTSYGLDRYSCSQSSGGRDRVLVFTKPLLVLKSSFNRPNIYYEVRFKDLLDDPYSDLCEYLKSFGNICSIVYCLEWTTCDDLAAHLSKKGLSCAAYHAGLNSKLRSSTLDGWISFKTQVIVATVAFGARDQTKAIRYLNAFAISSLSSQITKSVGREIENESSVSGPSGSSPRSFLRWMLNIENRGIKIFDDAKHRE